ncbi:hypothetical protein L2E82_22328 [Cichorium intybus]|uniref:Uncharacterized protein n=1 Tax=Cichorium intybus TaxID=13427 RepID=A0ACB9DXU7_CICIN|nr:hypothetical protein L2E82_22328 [Cichorium intybus]
MELAGNLNPIAADVPNFYVQSIVKGIENRNVGSELLNRLVESSNELVEDSNQNQKLNNQLNNGEVEFSKPFIEKSYAMDSDSQLILDIENSELEQIMAEDSIDSEGV